MAATHTSVIFPKVGDFSTVLNFGINTDPIRNIESKKILYILDGTGSMGEYINENLECSKSIMAKRIIGSVQLRLPANDYDIMVFNTKPYPICKLEEVPSPSGSTYFSPLVPELQKVVPDGNYCAVIFMSDGIPSEDLTVARDAIKSIGNITREARANPVALAIGSDADGAACGLFAGNRGYNCYIKYNKDVDEIVGDIVNGINCNYHVLENGAYIPVEADNQYYYVGDAASASIVTIKPDRKMCEKYLNLVIQKNINDIKNIPLLKSLVEHVVLLLDTEDDKTSVTKKYFDMLDQMKKVYVSLPPTSGAMLSAISSNYRQASQQV